MPSCIHRNTSVSCVRPRASFASAAQLRPILQRPRPIPPTFVSGLPAARSSWRHVAIDTIHSSLSLAFPPTQQSLAWIPFAFLLAPGFRSSTCPHPSSPTWCARFLPSRRLRLHPRSFFRVRSSRASTTSFPDLCCAPSSPFLFFLRHAATCFAHVPRAPRLSSVHPSQARAHVRAHRKDPSHPMPQRIGRAWRGRLCADGRDQGVGGDRVFESSAWEVESRWSCNATSDWMEGGAEIAMEGTKACVELLERKVIGIHVVDPHVPVLSPRSETPAVGMVGHRVHWTKVSFHRA